MPAYNVAPFLGATMDSVLAQTFADLELIVLDDGSTDDTAATAEARARRDPRVRVFRRANGGISSARNESFRHATAPLLAILDSDDLWAPEFLATQVAILDARPEVDIVTGNAWLLGGPRDGEPARPSPDPRPQPDLAELIADENAVFIMTVFRRRVYEAIGGFDESLVTNEDYDYWLRAAFAGFRFARNDRPLGWYRRRSGSLSSDDERMVTGILRVYDKWRPLLAGWPRELALLEAQVRRFETELLRVRATSALAARDFDALARHLSALRQRRGGAALTVASLMARWTPRLLTRAYELRRAI